MKRKNIGSTTLGRKKARRGISGKWFLIPVFIIIIGITGYFAGVVYYKSHFFKGTNVYGTDVSQMEVQDFEEGLTDYSLKIIQKDKDGVEFEEEFSSDALGLTE